MTTPDFKKHMDPEVHPGEDFNRFANGGWMEKHPIPDEFSRYGTFDLLREENRKLVKGIIEEVASKDHTGNRAARLVGSYFSSGMDTEKINALGHSPVRKELDKIDRIGSIDSLKQLFISMYRQGYPPLFFLYPSPDKENSEMIIANLHQGGMGLHDVDYYRNNDARSEEIRKEYKGYISKIFRLAGAGKPEADDFARTILEMETELAFAGMTRLELRDPYNVFNTYSLEKLKEDADQWPWTGFFSGMGIEATERINVGQPEFLKKVSEMITAHPIDHWIIFLKWRILNGAASYLSEPFEKAKFDFYEAYLSGKKTQQPRWKRVTAATETALGDALGKLFVARYFPPESKKRMTTLVEHLRNALAGRIRRLEWMSEETKVHALEKLARMRVKVGYPDKWRSYEGLEFSNQSFYENHKAASLFNMQYELDKIGKPADRDLWEMTPQTVNAYYHPLHNEIVFPAGILQPPFFYPGADDAVNFGAIGVVIGHEMTHGFDDQGRKFDMHGNLNDWWSGEDARRFSQRSDVLVEQYSKIQILDDVFADGKLTLGENIADLGGLNVALDGLKMAWQENAPENQTDGLTPLQRFFLAYAHIWANNTRDKEKIRLTKEDVHSLGDNRVNGPLPNVEEFYKAFGIRKEDRMFLDKKKRAEIW